MTLFSKIILPTRAQAETIIGIFLLRKFGKEKYPGIENAKIEIRQQLPANETAESLEKKGILCLDIGGGKFDHHYQKETLSKIIAKDLKIEEEPALQKLLIYGERDDRWGKGTISNDPIDKAFGLSGLITALNKNFPENPQRVVETILPLLEAHYNEERKKIIDLPQEFEEKMKSGKAQIFNVKQGKKKLKVIFIESNNQSLAGWLKAFQKADVVCQRTEKGYVNLTTRPLKKVDLRYLAAYLRYFEAKIRKRQINYSPKALMRPGSIPEIPEWYYDLATNSLLNGGPNPQGIEKSAIPSEKLIEIIKEALSKTPTIKKNYQNKSFPAHYFLEIRLPLEKALQLQKTIIKASSGVKKHLPQNYHLTLLHLGEQNQDLKEIIKKIESVLAGEKKFELTLRTNNLKAGKITGYNEKAFYFEIEGKEEIERLKNLREKLEKALPSFKNQEFKPHLTIASTLPNLTPEVILEAKLEVEKNKEISFPVEKIKLTGAFLKPKGEIVYKTIKDFYLG
jgi:2'-5' RNA ligase